MTLKILTLLFCFGSCQAWADADSEVGLENSTTPTLILSPNTGQVLTEISLRDFQGLIQTRSPTNILTDTSSRTEQLLLRAYIGFGSGWLAGLSFGNTQTNANSTVTDTVNNKTTSQTNANNFVDPTITFGRRLSQDHLSMVINIAATVPEVTTTTTSLGSTTNANETAKSLTPSWTPAIAIYTDDADKLRWGASVSYQLAANSRANAISVADVRTTTDTSGGNRSTLNLFAEKTYGRGTPGVAYTIYENEPTQSFTAGVESDTDVAIYGVGTLYYEYRTNDQFSIYPEILVQKIISGSKNGTTIDENQSLQFYLTTRYIF